MPRRQRPVVKGSDPAYSHQFETFEPVPSNMPPTVVIPGMEKPQPDPIEKAGDPAPDAARATTTPEAQEPAGDKGAKAVAEPSAERVTKPKVERTPELQGTNPRVAAPPAAAQSRPEGTMRRVSLKGALTRAHVEAMQPLVERGLARRDIAAVAGRRASAKFEPVDELVPLPEGDRMPIRDAYETSKNVRADLLDGLRQVHDPLRLKSDAAMVRGQFERLFWTELDAVIEELRKQYVD